MKINANNIKSTNIQDAIEEILAAYPGIGVETAEIAATHIISLDEDWTDDKPEEVVESAALAWARKVLAKIDADTIDPLVTMSDGCWIESLAEIQEDQKFWGDEDRSKNSDFSGSPYWITVDSGDDPVGISTAEELAVMAKEYCWDISQEPSI